MAYFIYILIIVNIYYTNAFIYQLQKSNSKRLLSNNKTNSLFETFGSSSSLNYYYTNLYIGSDYETQSYVLDTGSIITTSPCKPYSKQCGQHEYKYYTVNSDTKKLTCENKFCSQVNSQCIDNICSFDVSYSEGSSLKGLYINETIKMNNNKEVNLPIGCTIEEKGIFYNQNANGIMGLGNNDNNFVTILYKNGLIKNNIFSICLAQNGGYWSIGEIQNTYHDEEIKYVNYIEGEKIYYSITVNSVIVNGQDITPKNDLNDFQYTAIIDSGTTMSYFPKEIADKIISNFKEICKTQKNKGKCGNYYNDITLGACYIFKSIDEMNYAVNNIWPSIEFNIDNRYNYIWEAKDYSFNNTYQNTYSMCLGFISEKERKSFIFGSTWMHGHDIIFDRTNKQIGFTNANCDGILKKTNPDNINNHVINVNEKVINDMTIHIITKDLNTDNQNLNLNQSAKLYGFGCVILIILIIICVIGIYKLQNNENFLCFKLSPSSLGYTQQINYMDKVYVENDDNHETFNQLEMSNTIGNI